MKIKHLFISACEPTPLHYRRVCKRCPFPPVVKNYHFQIRQCEETRRSLNNSTIELRILDYQQVSKWNDSNAGMGCKRCDGKCRDRLRIGKQDSAVWLRMLEDSSGSFLQRGLFNGVACGSRMVYKPRSAPLLSHLSSTQQRFSQDSRSSFSSGLILI